MYEIRHGGSSTHLNTIKGVIQKITDVHNECKQHELQMLIVNFNNIMIEVGVGDEHDRVLLIFSDKSSNEDTMLSYNKGSADDAITFHRKTFIPFECREHNLIPFDVALEGLRQMLSTNSLSDTIKWYSL